MNSKDRYLKAVLIWRRYDDGTPSEADFQSAPAWSLAQAVEQTLGLGAAHGLRPWIRWRNRILSDEQIEAIRLALRALDQLQPDADDVHRRRKGFYVVAGDVSETTLATGGATSRRRQA